MTLSAHCAVGAALGAALGNPWVVIPVALASHLILDSFPHTDLAHLRKPNSDGTLSDDLAWWAYAIVLIDILIVIAILVWSMTKAPALAGSIATGAVAGMFFDYQYIPVFGPWMSRQWWYRGIHWLHEPGHMHFPLRYDQRWYGIHTTLITIVSGILWLKSFLPV